MGFQFFRKKAVFIFFKAPAERHIYSNIVGSEFELQWSDIFIEKIRCTEFELQRSGI